MTVNNPTFATPATAKRGAKARALENFKIVPKGDRVELRDMDRPLYNNAAREKSVVEGAVGIVWDLCADMIPNGAKRKEIVAKAVEMGVALNTARTQYQYYRKAAGLVKERA